MQKLSHFNSVVLRTPLLPLTCVSNLSREGIVSQFRDNPLLREALFLASPTLFNSFLKFFVEGKECTDKEREKVIQSLTKYYCRMATRSTPFGLFSGCSVIRVSDRNDVTLKDRQLYRARVRFDMNYLCALTDYLARHPLVKPHLKYFSNTGIYSIGEKLRYFEHYYVSGIRFHKISSVDKEENIESILERAKSGVSYEELVKDFHQQGYQIDEINEYLNQVIDSRIIVSEFEPSITGVDILSQLLSKLKAIISQQKIAYETQMFLQNVINELDHLKQQLAHISDSPLGTNYDRYLEIVESVKKLRVEFNPQTLFQADLIKPLATGKFSPALIEKVKEGIRFLSKISIHSPNRNLEDFKNKFFERYEYLEKPLLEVLDPDIGICYPTKIMYDQKGKDPLLANIYLPGNEQTSYSADDREIFWIKKILDANLKRLQEIEVTDHDLTEIGRDIDDYFLTTASAAVKVLNDAEDPSEIEISMSSAGFNGSAGMLVARFCDADPEIEHFVGEIVAAEKAAHPETILAEIVHLPESRTGNILLRPVLRDHEIPFLAQSTLGEENVIRLEDLSISIRNGRIILFSTRHNAEVIPKLTNAHNYLFKSLPLYHFLCDLQFEQSNNYGIGFEIPRLALKIMKFIPRMVYKKIIFSQAQWLFKKKDVESLLSASDTYIAIGQWRSQYYIPRYVTISHSDNELFIDLENELSLSVFLQEIKNKESFELREFIFGTNNLVKDELGKSYSNELIFAFHKEPKISPSHSAGGDTHVALQRKFIIGDDWLFFKLYTGFSTADAVLLHLIKPMTERLTNSALITKWFFIRYGDPESHIRVRLKVASSAHYAQVIGIFNEMVQPFLSSNQVWKVQTDTYNREIERYGSNTMELSEDLFHIDSIFTTAFLSFITDDGMDSNRWFYAIHVIDDMLDAFDLSTTEKLMFCENSKRRFIQEFGGHKGTNISLDYKFRELKGTIRSILAGEQPELKPLTTLLSERSMMIKKHALAIRELNVTEPLKISLHSLIESHIHMMINRIFKGHQRVYEMTCYALLTQHFQSKLAQEKKKITL